MATMFRVEEDKKISLTSSSIQVLGPYSADFLGTLAGSMVGNKVAGT